MQVTRMSKQELLQVAKPILFNTEMVRAIQDDRKTVTRRVIKNIPENYGLIGWNGSGNASFGVVEENCHMLEGGYSEPKYKIGDILYVRETWTYGTVEYGEIDSTHGEFYVEQGCADDDFIPKEAMLREKIGIEDVVWKPSIHMPKKHARIFLRVTDVRVERIQDITEEEAVKEGFITTFRDGLYMTAKEMFLKVMMDIYGINDGYVYVYEFERIEVEE